MNNNLLKTKAYNFNEPFIIALDGVAASGKGLIASMLRDKFKLEYIQSSLPYRKLAHLCLKNKINTDDKSLLELFAESICSGLVEDSNDLYSEEISILTSKISALAEVRYIITKYLRSLALKTPRLVMEGRDIATVVLPDADLKIFLTASIEVRAKRRYKQLLILGKECTMHRLLSSIKDRDERDRNRAISPLMPAIDSCVIDTSDLEPNQVISRIESFI